MGLGWTALAGPAVALTLVGSAEAAPVAALDLLQSFSSSASYSRAISPDGGNLYVGRALCGAGGPCTPNLLVYARDPTDGSVTIVQQVWRTAQVLDVAVRPDGALVLTSNALSSRIESYVRSPVDGTLVFADEDTFAPTGRIAVSGDSRHLYATSGVDKSVLVYDVSSAGGALVFIEEVTDDVGGVDGLEDPTDVALSPDDAHVYVCNGSWGDAVSVFGRAAGTGRLTAVEVQRDGVGGVSGLRGCGSITVSPDGAHVYVVSYLSEGVVVFSRDAGTGRLTFLHTVAGPNGEAEFGPDPTLLFSHQSYPGRVSTWRRDPVAGALTLLQSFLVDPDGRGGVGVASPDGQHVYVVGLSSSPQGATFHVVSAECRPAPLTGCEAATAGRSVLVMRREPTFRNRLVWRWVGTETFPSFGEPDRDAGYSFCVYDASGGAQPRFAASAAPGGVCLERPCWRPKPTIGWIYKGAAVQPEGLVRIRLSEGVESARAKVRGGGEALTVPAGPLTLPVLVQLQRGDADVCWEASFGTARVNTTDEFRARSD